MAGANDEGSDYIPHFRRFCGRSNDNPRWHKAEGSARQTISSATAEQGQAVELSITDAVKINDQIVIPDGSRVTGTVTMAQEKRHMGRAGKLDFSIDRVRAIDGEWIPIRYTLNKASRGSHAVSMGVLTAGAAVLFWPAAPPILLIKGKDVTINKGVVFDAFTDADHVLKGTGGTTVAGSAGKPSPFANGNSVASVAITSNVPGADIEIDGAFIGSTPTTASLATGTHQIAVRNGNALWQRNLQVSAGSTVTLNAQLEGAQMVSTRKPR
ncbi:MAG: PEGA domain-containing protein [Bryobacteraceae bacterium]